MYRNRAWHKVSSFVLILYCSIIVVLFGLILINSVKTQPEIFKNIWGLPQNISFSKFADLMTEFHFGTYFSNSLIITIISVVVSTYIAAMTSYGIAKFVFKGSSFLYLFFMLGLMFPVQLGIVPLYIFIRQIGLNNSIYGICLINCGTISFSVFVLTGFIKTISNEIIEACKIDGANQFFIFNKIILPLSAPALGAVIPLVAVRTWNDFFVPMIFLTKDSTKTIPLGLMRFFIGEYFDISKMDLVFAAAAVSLVPIILLYIVSSNQIASGISAGAVKG